MDEGDICAKMRKIGTSLRLVQNAGHHMDYVDEKGNRLVLYTDGTFGIDEAER